MASKSPKQEPEELAFPQCQCCVQPYRDCMSEVELCTELKHLSDAGHVSLHQLKACCQALEDKMNAARDALRTIELSYYPHRNLLMKLQSELMKKC